MLFLQICLYCVLEIIWIFSVSNQVNKGFFLISEKLFYITVVKEQRKFFSSGVGQTATCISIDILLIFARIIPS